MHPTSALRTRSLSVALAAALVVLGACSGGDDTVAVSEDSGERSSTSDAGGDAGEYCQTAEELTSRSGGLDLSEDAEGALAGIERLAATAPDELADDFTTFVTGVRGIAELDEDDPDALTGILELMTDPEFSAAADTIEEYTGEVCGIDLGAGSGGGGDEEGAEDGVGLEDVDAVKDENASSSWPEKLSTTTIGGGTNVRVSSEFEAITPDEAMEACNALLSSLAMIDPEVTVEVADGDTVLVETVDGLCVDA